jgi:hypothetical protein
MRVTCEEARAIAAAGIREVVEPCLRSVLRGVEEPARRTQPAISRV